MAGSEVCLGLVTVTFNSRDVLEAFFDCLAAQRFRDWRLYLVDNHSSDGSVDQVALKTVKNFDHVVIRNDANVGFAAATNQGVQAALEDRCTHVLIINNDVEFGPTLLSDLLSAAERLMAPIVAPKILYPSEDKKIWYAGGRLIPWRGFICKHYGMGNVDRGQYDREKRVEFASGCCLLVSATVFEKVGFFDPNFFVYFEDIDFCYRVKKLGLDIWFTPTVALYHKVSSLTGSGSNFTTFQNARGQAYFLTKHFPKMRGFWWLALQAKLVFKFLRSSRHIGYARCQWSLERRAVHEAFSMPAMDSRL